MPKYLRRLRDKDVGRLDLSLVAGGAFAVGTGLIIAKLAGYITIGSLVPWLFIGAGAITLLVDALRTRKRRR